MTTELKLKRLKEKIDQALTERTEAEGSLKTLMKRLKDEFGCTSIKEAQKKLRDLQKRLETIDSEIDEKIAELEEALAT